MHILLHVRREERLCRNGRERVAEKSTNYKSTGKTVRRRWKCRQEDFEDGTGINLLALRPRKVSWIDHIHIFLEMLHFLLQHTFLPFRYLATCSHVSW
jgi:hypothetical protein